MFIQHVCHLIVASGKDIQVTVMATLSGIHGFCPKSIRRAAGHRGVYAKQVTRYVVESLLKPVFVISRTKDKVLRIEA